MHTFRRAPQRTPSSYQCFQCRHATTKTTPKSSKNRLSLKATARDLAERSAILRHRVHSARVARREDWLLGPLAPNRAAADPEYGCVNVGELRGTKGLHRTKQGRSPHMAPEMSWDQSLIEVGDRVVVVANTGPASRERGKVGRVTAVKKERRECVVDNLNEAQIKVPAALKVMDPNAPPVRKVTLPIPLSAVRLVSDIKHADGETCHTIIAKMVKLPNRKGRYIANSQRVSGDWIRIPEKKRYKEGEKGEKEEKEGKDGDSDTLRYQVDEATWKPTLLHAPMPGGVIDELRNKYSKYRTRHDPAYQLALDNRERRKAEWKAWAKSGGSMLSSPAKEAAAKARDERAALPKPTLKTEILEKIGEVMASKGIELTAQRQKEMERNLIKEEVVKGAGDGGVVKVKAEIVNEDAEKIVNAEGDLQDAMGRLGIDDMVIEEEADQARDAGREVRR